MRTNHGGTWARTALALTALTLVLAACGSQAPAADDEVTTVPTTPTVDPADEPGSDHDPTGTPAGQPVANPEPAQPTPAPPAPTPPTPTVHEDDGTWPGIIVAADAGHITIDKVDILGGQEANDARAEDGQPPADESVDIPYVRNRNPKLRVLPVAGDVTVQVYDCNSGCQLVTRTYASLVAGAPLPYGGEDTPFTVTVKSGQVTTITQVYLP